MSDSDQSEIPETPRQSESPTTTTTTKRKSTHPSTRVMVGKALKEIGNNRKGISMQKIKSFVATNFNINHDRINIYINKYVKAAVGSGVIIQTKGTGAVGSFKISPDKVNSKKANKSTKSTGKITKTRAKAAKNTQKKPKTQKEQEKQ